MSDRPAPRILLPPARSDASAGRSLRADVPRLADHDAASLAALLAGAGGSASAARAAAHKVLRHVFGGRHAAAALARSTSRGRGASWHADALRGLGVGAWAHAALLDLDPGLSLSIAERAPAADETVRLVLRARDGALVEAVIIPGPARTTLCISSQVGCARACSFCETGAAGLDRQLRAAEMVDQVRIALALLDEANAADEADAAPAPRADRDAGRGRAPLRNLVFMGMGEPLDNLGEVARAIRLLTDGRAFGFAPSHVTVSTVGVADKLDAFFRAAPAELAVSLNAPDDARRRRIMPINARFPLAPLRDALARALPAGRRVLFEYVLFDRFNDAVEDADLLADYVAGLRCRVNVIPCNPGPDPALRPPSPARVDAFVARLSGRGVTTLVRRPRGRDVGGACGQLAGRARAGTAP